MCVCLFLNSMVKPALSLHMTILCHKIRWLISLVESTESVKDSSLTDIKLYFWTNKVIRAVC